ncbi:Sugar transporter ERD6-like [Quillaja saponaria]|uniref:Sugar transporter ERD6-like n=1 Tax=Quillaja saponaria TaxID=32244 RepID=A0AAD7QAY2_QUISA|nr:Sugar transporter ERD6-like [Quillaja saponaria]
MLMLPMAAVFMFFIGSSVHWRTIALIGIVPCMPPLVAVIFISESPRWLAKMGRAKECESALEQLRGKNADIFQEAADIKECNKLLNQISDDGIMNLFQLKYAHIVIVGVGLMAMQQLGGLNGFSLYTSEIFDAAGFPSKLGFIVVSLGQLPLIFAGAYLIDKLGRLTLLMVSATGTFLGCFLTGLSFFFQGLHWFEEYTPTLVLIGALAFLGSSSLGMGPIPWLIVSEISPINVKGSLGSTCNFVNWFCSWFVAYTFNFLFQWSSAGTCFIYSIICCLSIIFTAKLVPETKGKSLEEIHASQTQDNALIKIKFSPVALVTMH